MTRSFLVRPNMRAHRATFAALCLVAACGGGAGGGGDDGPDAAPEQVPVLRRASKASTVAITGDDKTVVMVNPETKSITIFDAVSQTARATLITGNEPSSVVIAPDDKTAFVANRADATIVKVTGIDGASPALAGSVDVGSEPTGVALSPTGATLYVAEFAESRVAVIDTKAMSVRSSIAVDRPRAVAVTNNGDQNDADETIVVPSFYGEPIGDEATDTSRQGRVHLYAASDLHESKSIVLAPRDSGFAPSTAAQGAPTVKASANQLWAAAVAGSKVYIPSVSASPAPPLDFQANVQPIAYVIDLAAGAEDTGPLGSLNLAQLLRDNTDAASTRFFLADTVDVSFVGDKVAYYVSRGADVVQRIQYTGTAPTFGSSRNKQIELNTTPAGSKKACQNPTGIVVNHAGSFAYVNCWVTRQLGVVDLTQQALTKTIESASVSVDEADAQQGRRFYFTGRGRWSKNAWSDCGSCHPDGLSDNITWSFNAGPRQTTSMDGTFSHHAGELSQKQRVLNWTGIFDEIHDFERNTRGVSGGLGAVTTAGTGGCGDVATEVRVDVDPNTATQPGGLSTPVKAIIAANTVCVHDWDKVEAWVKTIRPPRGRRTLDAASVARGAALFGESDATHANAGCNQCHGGPGWTSSRVFYKPEADAVSALHTTVFGAGFLIQQEPTTPARKPEQVACVIRNVSTFGAAALEQRLVNGALVPAQGSLGFNVPSLYGLNVGAPYLHHGQAKTLAALFDEDAFAAHAEAGSPVWLHTGSDAEVAQRKADLINFLLSIDATTAEQTLPAKFDLCPAGP
jgi:DNA-binding beta-propeller fold protein YncE